MDPVWIENMNAVMDDNRMLALANGERIRLEKHCTILFEVSVRRFDSFSVSLRVRRLPFSV